MVYSYRSAMARIAVLCGLSAVQLVASSWPEEFVQRYEAHGLALLHTNEADWVQRTNEYGLRRPTHACQIFVYRAFDLWSQMGPMYRATVSVTQFMIPDEILWRIAVYWPDLGNHWHEASWRLHPVDDSRSASCLPDLIQPTYVLVMPGLLNEMAHRPHGLLEVTQGDICHVRATVLPPRINRLTLLASSLAPCWGDRESWDEWLLMELRHRYLALCGLAVHLHAVHSSIGDLDACYDPGRTYMVTAPERPPCSLEEAVAVLYVRVRVEGFYDEGAVWCPAAIACGAMIEQLGLFVACHQQGSCRCYLNGNPLHNDPVAVTHGDFLAIFKSDHAHRVLPGHAALSLAAGGRQGGYHGTVSECSAEQCSEAASGSCSDAAHSVD